MQIRWKRTPKVKDEEALLMLKKYMNRLTTSVSTQSYELRFSVVIEAIWMWLQEVKSI